MICEYCKKECDNGQVVAGCVLHQNCITPFKHAMNGRPHICPHCLTTGEIRDTTRTVKKWVTVSEGEYAPCAYNDCRGCSHCGQKPIYINPLITCPTCNGEGYTAVEFEPTIEKVVTGYKPKC